MPALISEIVDNKGPCECYQHAEKIFAIKKGMNGSAGVIGENSSYADALIWVMQNYRKSDCIRFLLRLKQVLQNPPKPLFSQKNDRVKEYWDTYGTVLGELINRDVKTNAALQSQAYWRELFEAFAKATPEQWSLRRGYITSFAETVDKCLDNVFVQSNNHFIPFWDSVNDFLQFFEMSFECKEILDGEISETFAVFLDLIARLSQWVCRLQSNSNSIQPQTYLNLSTILEQTLPLIGKAEVNFHLGYERWFQSIRSLLSCSSADCFPGVRDNFERISRSLYKAAKNEKAPVVKSQFEHQLEFLQPKLQCRKESGPKRKIPLSHFKTCHLKSDTPHISPLMGTILNICPRTYKGFCIETDEIEVLEPIDYPAEVPAAIRGVRKKLKLKSLLLDIKYYDHKNRQERQIEFDCRIQRAWNLPHGGSGFALLDSTGPHNRCDAWVAYVDSLVDGGRYQA